MLMGVLADEIGDFDRQLIHVGDPTLLFDLASHLLDDLILMGAELL